MDPQHGSYAWATHGAPAGPSSAAVRVLLLHLEHAGFDGASRFLGTDELRRAVLSYVEGDVPLPPYPGWALTDSAVTDLGRLLRRFHDATSDVDRGSATGWSSEWSDPGRGDVICHNDLFPENVVFRRGGSSASSTSPWPPRGGGCGTWRSPRRSGARCMPPPPG